MANNKNDKPKKKPSLSFRVGSAFWLILFIVVMTLILSVNLGQEQVFLVEGEIAGDDVYHRGGAATYISELRTTEAKNAAASSVEPVYVIDGTVVELLSEQIDGYFGDISTVALNYDAYDEAALAALRNSLPGSYEDELLYALLDMSEDERNALRDSFRGFIMQAYAGGVLESEVAGIRQDILLSITSSTISGEKELFLKSLLAGIKLPYNEAYDAIATSEAVAAAQDAVASVQITVQPGEKLVSRGSIVTAEQLEALQKLGMLSQNPVYTPYIGLLILTTLLSLLMFFYMRTYQPQVFRHRSSMILLAVVILVILLLCKLISMVAVDSSSELDTLMGYLLPVAAASMLLTVLLNRGTAILSTVLLSVCMSVIMGGDIRCGLVALASGLAGAISASKLSQRSQFVNASIYIILANVAMIAGWGLLWSEAPRMIAIGCVFGVVNGLLSAVLAMGILPFLESAFGITTVIRLLELSNSNDPLLKRLMMEAPGTYNHSILVGNMAEAAADAIGADALLVRVASYYHDIGKLKRPHFYIENQRPGENPHDKLQPALSAMIITSHPVDGIKTLKERRFPSEIIDIVDQHHGSGVLQFFYHKAKENAVDPEEIRIEDFRYKGRKPQTKEAALVMLADSVQAGVQALRGADRAQVEARVRDIIQHKIEEGQLEESPLTFKDIDTIIQTFLMVLSGMNHIRISYPGQEQGGTGGLNIEALSQDIEAK